VREDSGDFFRRRAVIGWSDGEEVFLQPDAAYAAARRFAETSLPLGITKTVGSG
jgi:hypothetical protein